MSLIGSSADWMKQKGGIALVATQMSRQFLSLHEPAAGCASHSSCSAYSSVLQGSHSQCLVKHLDFQL